MSAWLRSNMSSTRTTPSPVTYTATLPPSPEIMYRSPLTFSMRSGPGGFAVCVYTTHALCAAAAATKRPASAVLFSLIVLLFLFGWRGCGRSHADDLQNAFFVPRAVVVDLFGRVDDEAAGGHGLEARGIVLRTGIDPPRAGD